MEIAVLLIDPQNDFCDPQGSLFVAGANEDMLRVGDFIKRIGDKITKMNITLDTHRILDVAHPVFWINSSGENPAPFTIIEADDVKNGAWTATHAGMRKRALEYVTKLNENGRYPLCIWPPHCLIGSWGHNIYPAVLEAVHQWEKGKGLRYTNYVTKGSNYFTEHYSAVKADVPDPEDFTTQLNTGLIEILESSDQVLIMGEALSHCVANTVRDIADEFGDENIKKLVFVEDASSSVTSFENLGEDFVKEMTGRGMQVTTTKDFLCAAV